MDLEPRSPLGYLGQPLTATQQRFLALQIVLIVLATIAVGLRLYARNLIKARLWWDDYTIIFAWVLCLAEFGQALAFIPEGLAITDAYERIEAFLLTSMTFLLVYVINATIIKFSILLLYSRIFNVQPFMIVIYVVSAVAVLWCISSFCAILFMCTPINSFWKMDQPHHCVNQYIMFIGTAAGNSLLDIVILCMPIKRVWSLKMTVSKRIQIILTFVLGAFVCTISIVRMIVIIHQPASDEDVAAGQLSDITWTTVEQYVGVICACLPAIRPLLNRSSSVSSRLATSRRTTNHSTPSRSPSNQHFWHSSSPRSHSDKSAAVRDDDTSESDLVPSRLDSWRKEEGGPFAPGAHGVDTMVRSGGSQDLESAIPLEGIRVEREMESSWAPRAV